MSSVKQGIAEVVGMWRILLKICWSSQDQHGGEVGGLIDSQLREVEICRWGGRGGEGGQSTANSDRICSQLTEDPHSVDPGGVNWQPTQTGSAAKSERICTECWSWGGQLTANSDRIRSQVKRGSTQCWSWGGQLTANSERICSVDSRGVNWQST